MTGSCVFVFYNHKKYQKKFFKQGIFAKVYFIQALFFCFMEIGPAKNVFKAV